MLLKSVNPFNNSLIGEYEAYDQHKIAYLINKGEKAFADWRKTSIERRCILFLRCAENLIKDKVNLAQAITLEMGKPIRESIAEIEKCATVCRYYSENAEKFLKDEYAYIQDVKAYIHFQPLGGILAVMPWNYPFWQVFRFAVPALIAGNVGFLKHASNVSQCSLAIEELLIKSDFPEGVFQTLLIGSQSVKEVIEHPFIKAISLTGSEKAGSEVSSIAGRNIKKTVLELGGSDPFIVLKDADIKEAAHIAVKSRYKNNGQSCIAAKRFIIEDAVYDEFLNECIVNVNVLKVGNPLEEFTDIGPMARIDLRDELLEMVRATVSKGGELLLGGSEPDKKSAFFDPAILAVYDKNNPAYKEEMFGPVAVFMKAKNEQEAIKIANDTKFGLGASIWTADKNRGESMAKQIEAGNVFINSLVSSDPRLPFGGINASGYGRELGSYGLKEFVNIKTIYVQ